MKKRDLSKLSREEKLRLYDLAQEKKRRAREQRALYKPNAGQLQVHQSMALDTFVFAGNGGGKTTLAVHEVVWAAQGYNPIKDEFYKVPARVIVVLDSPAKVEDLWLPAINQWFDTKEWVWHKRGKPYINEGVLPNGSSILFMFHLQEPMAFESIEAQNLICYDEPPPRDVFIALKRASRTKGHRTRHLIIGTPIAASWLRKNIYEPWSRGELPDTTCIKYSTQVNAHNLADGFMEEFTRHMTEKEKRVRLDAEFFDLEGLALAHLFNRSTHLVPAVKWPHNWPVVVALDFHPRKAHVALMLGVTPQDELVALKEFSSRAEPSKLAGELREFYAGYRVLDLVCDSLGNGELTGGEGNLSFIQVLNNNGAPFRATRFKEKNDEAWVQMIQEVLSIPEAPDNMGRKEPRLKIVASCTGLISDIESVEWEKFKNVDEFKPRLAIGAKDYLACLKYALACQPRFTSDHARIIRPRGPVGLTGRHRASGITR